ncbi:hypothetical protein FJT64_001569 [Amphibalanus amphitrite]|uniref:Uncharacterized protein n=1 Tax=Amphibalanus amphitrite TaxID=1232801 RepID=A0A6A4X2Q5_AMPAM|nr:hypothetical protein FJT64_001569 [Amphibalanus amphitrite]
MPNSSQSSPQQQQQQQQQQQEQQQQQQQAQPQIIASSGVPITFDGQEATFIPAGTHGSLVSGAQFLSGAQLVRPQNLIGSNVVQSVGTQAISLSPGRQLQVQTPNGIQFVQVPVQQSMQTISVQIPMSTAGGQTVYQTVQLPVAAAGGAQQLQLMPQIQVGGAMPQYAQVLTPSGQLQQVQVVPAHHLASLQQAAAAPATAASTSSQPTSLSTTTSTTSVMGSAQTSPAEEESKETTAAAAGAEAAGQTVALQLAQAGLFGGQQTITVQGEWPGVEAWVG